jgi:hypothetical protein
MPICSLRCNSSGVNQNSIAPSTWIHSCVTNSKCQYDAIVCCMYIDVVYSIIPPISDHMCSSPEFVCFGISFLCLGGSPLVLTAAADDIHT